MTSLLAADDWLSNSFLNEAGVKFAFLDNHLVGSLDWYRQERTQLQQSLGSVSVMGTRSKGERGGNPRMCWTRISASPWPPACSTPSSKGPDNVPVYSRAHRRRLAATGFRRHLCDLNFSSLRMPGNYEDTLVPHAVISPYLTYTSDDGQLGRQPVGGTYVTHTAQTVPDPIIFPSYVTLNASGFLRVSAIGKAM